MAFSHKYLKFDFNLAHGQFQGGGNSYSCIGLRSSASIVKAGGLSQGALEFAVYGLPLDVMNQLSTFGQTLTLTGKNTVTVSAGDDPNALSVVYIGNISSAFMDGNAQPQVAFRGEAFSTGELAVMPTPTTTQPGSVDAGGMLQALAKASGLQFENNGVSTKITNPHYSGSPLQQIEAICTDAKCEHIVDNNILAIWPSSGSRPGSTDISPQTTLVGYPSFNSQGILFKALFDPTLTYGAAVKVTSQLQAACKTWIIHHLVYELETETPKGNWFVIVQAHLPGEQPVS